MHQNKIWLFFLSLIVIAMIAFSFCATQQVMHYRHLSLQVPAHVMRWDVQEEKADLYTIMAEYFFEYQGRTYSGYSKVTSSYKNPWSAQKALSGFQQRAWSVWVDPKHPMLSTLYKPFPYKSVLSASVLVGLVVYLAILGVVVGGQYGRRAH
ncbi:MAG: DUF3592 domain-containing protein [Verrucomicrobia bacterium]|nr:DUF3592 domain-containing protein [Verrucomicrobiota bacterium]MBS0646156.1 DUF3592 domain-containing protein [Verrucomicrobiota bacterium]